MVSIGQLDPAPDVHPIMKDYQWTAMPHPLGPARTRNAGCKQTNKINEEQNDSTIRERTRGEPKINSEWPNVIPFFFSVPFRNRLAFFFGILPFIGCSGTIYRQMENGQSFLFVCLVVLFVHVWRNAVISFRECIPKGLF